MGGSPGSSGEHADEIVLLSTEISAGLWQTDLNVPGISCGACINKIEYTLSSLVGVEQVRVNLGARRIRVLWSDPSAARMIGRKLLELGYSSTLSDTDPNSEKDGQLSRYLRALAVAGFAAGNIMLLSVSVWSGADEATRTLFHWISAMIAIPALIYSGRVFYESAWHAVRHRRTNMDVPISVGVILTCLLGVYDTISHGEQVYFEASVMLVFFLLIGRTLDHMMREKASNAKDGLLSLSPKSAVTVSEDGSSQVKLVGDIVVGDLVLLDPGRRVPVDGVIETGSSELDCSLVTGESRPIVVTTNSGLLAGTLNLVAPITLRVTATFDDSFLARAAEMVSDAQAEKGLYQRVADRAAKLYAPVVHMAAGLSLLVWFWLTGDLHHSTTIAVAVLIITCPCAIGLAVPMVQVVAAGRLFEQGVLMKNGSALERLHHIDTVVFDKTGTLTSGQPELENASLVTPEILGIAQRLAVCSQHPYARALMATEYCHKIDSHKVVPEFSRSELRELPGKGIEAEFSDDLYRLGNAEWALQGSQYLASIASPGSSTSVLSRNGESLAVFHFRDSLREGARECVQTLKKFKLSQEIIYGDDELPVHMIANQIGIERFRARMTPAQKTRHVQSLTQEGQRVLMVGDGLNDSGALAAAHVSMAPSSASDIGRCTADFVFVNGSLSAINETISVARQANRLVRLNFIIAIAYNIVALPFAILGYVTPLIAALAMSSSSILVIANALRLKAGIKRNSSGRQTGRDDLESARTIMNPL